MSRKTNKACKKNRKNKKYRKKTYKMKGGNFNQNDVGQLTNLGFNNEQINLLSEHVPNVNLVMQALHQINPNTGNNFTPQELIDDLQNELNTNMDIEEENPFDISGIHSEASDEHDIDFGDNSFHFDDDDNHHDTSIHNSMNTTMDDISNISNNSNMNTLNLSDSVGTGFFLNDSDLNVSNHSQNTTRDNSFGGKKTKKNKKIRKNNKNNTKKYKKNNKVNKNKKGGANIGANCPDPNLSLYNTNMLKLFPYRP